MDFITPALLNGVGVVAVVLMFGIGLIRAISRGDLVTRRERDDLAADRDVWRSTTLETKEILARVVDGQEVTNKLLRAIPHVEDRANENL